jgi:hypothetical protein
MEISIEIPQKTKNRLPYDLSLPLLGIFLKKCKSIYKKDTCILMFLQYAKVKM